MDNNLMSTEILPVFVLFREDLRKVTARLFVLNQELNRVNFKLFGEEPNKMADVPVVSTQKERDLGAIVEMRQSIDMLITGMIELENSLDKINKLF